MVIWDFKKIEKVGGGKKSFWNQNIEEWKLEVNNKLSNAWKMNSWIITIGKLTKKELYINCILQENLLKVR